MAGSVMLTVYNQFSTTYMQNRTVGRYDAHKRSDLRKLCHSMAKVNRDAPLYMIDSGEETKKYVVNLKEDSRELHNTIISAMGDVENTAFNGKIAYSTNDNVVSAKYVGDHSVPFSPLSDEEEQAGGAVLSATGEIPSYEIEVMSLASSQVNLGTYLPMNESGPEPGEYSFDISVGDLGYEFQFNINESDTNYDIQQRLSRLINNSKIGLNASVEEDGEGNAALRIESVRVGTESGQSSNVFTISDENTSKNAGAVSYLGIDYIAREASNARFTINGEEASATSNTFILQNDYEITLNGISESEGQTTTIGVKPDTDSLQENISNLIGGYNDFIKAVSQYRDTQQRSRHLLNEVGKIAGLYEQEMAKLGISPGEDGTLQLNSEQLTHSVATDETPEALSSLKAFSQSILRKSNQISLNPVSYVNKTVVAYKKPGNNFLQPYVTSAYAGMFFNNYC